MPHIYAPGEILNAETTDLQLSSCKECEARGGQSTTAPFDRREFVSRSVIAAVGALLTTACGGGSTAIGPGGGSGSFGTIAVQVSSYPALASVGGIARVDSGQGTPVAAVRTSATTFSAFSLICPHFGCTVGIATGSFACPCHGARFAVNGKWTGGQPTNNLSALSASYDSTSGTLTITA